MDAKKMSAKSIFWAVFKSAQGVPALAATGRSIADFHSLAWCWCGVARLKDCGPPDRRGWTVRFGPVSAPLIEEINQQN